jgi:hypothetical protein
MSSLRCPYLIETSRSYKINASGSQSDIAPAECRYRYFIQAHPARPLIVMALRSFPVLNSAPGKASYMFALSTNERGCGVNYAAGYIPSLYRGYPPPPVVQPLCTPYCCIFRTVSCYCKYVCSQPNLLRYNYDQIVHLNGHDWS